MVHSITAVCIKHPDFRLGLPLDALGVYLPGTLREGNFSQYFRICSTSIGYSSLKIGNLASRWW